MPQYRERFEPRAFFNGTDPDAERAPIPVVRNIELAFLAAGQGQIIGVESIDRAVVDSGADFSLLDASIYEYMVDDDRHLFSATETWDASGRITEDVPCVLMYYKLPKVTKDWERAWFLFFGPEFLIGRNITKKYLVKLDGPGKELVIES